MSMLSLFGDTLLVIVAVTVAFWALAGAALAPYLHRPAGLAALISGLLPAIGLTGLVVASWRTLRSRRRVAAPVAPAATSDWGDDWSTATSPPSGATVAVQRLDDTGRTWWTVAATGHAALGAAAVVVAILAARSSWLEVQVAGWDFSVAAGSNDVVAVFVLLGLVVTAAAVVVFYAWPRARWLLLAAPVAGVWAVIGAATADIGDASRRFSSSANSSLGTLDTLMGWVAGAGGVDASPGLTQAVSESARSAVESGAGAPLLLLAGTLTLLWAATAFATPRYQLHARCCRGLAVVAPAARAARVPIDLPRRRGGATAAALPVDDRDWEDY